MKLTHTTRKLNDFGRTLILAIRKELKQQQHIASGNLLRSFKSPRAKKWCVKHNVICSLLESCK